jgi:hypothetical protein
MYAHIYTYIITCIVFHVKHFDVLYPGRRGVGPLKPVFGLGGSQPDLIIECKEKRRK